MNKLFNTGVLALATLASTSSAHEGHNDNKPSSFYSLVADYSGPTFFDGFVTFTGPDPTHGKVNYTDKAFAANTGLLGFNYHQEDNSTRARIGVDSTDKAPGSTGRNSVRLTSKATFNAGTLLVADITHMPVGPGLWPALWLLGTGAEWPAAGEIDILETVHDTPYNAMTLHTAPGCSVANSSASAPFAGHLQNPDCNAGSAMTGCSIHAPETFQSEGKTLASAGEAFNAQAGAVYATEWTPQGINIWAFARSAVPASLNTPNPDPNSFPPPLASFSGPGCDYAKSFRDMALIVNTDFCGDWAGRVWQSLGKDKGTGVKSCEEFVGERPGEFRDAFWEFNSIRIFGEGGKAPGKNPDVGREGFGVL